MEAYGWLSLLSFFLLFETKKAAKHLKAARHFASVNVIYSIQYQKLSKDLCTLKAIHHHIEYLWKLKVFDKSLIQIHLTGS